MPNDGVHSWYLQSLERGQKFQWKIQWILHKSSASWQRLVKSFPPRDKLYWRQKRALSLNLYNAVTITSLTLSQWSFKVLILLFNYLSSNPPAYFLQFCTKGLMTVLQFKPLFTQLEFTKKRRRFSTNTQLNLHFLKLKKNPFSILRPLKHQKTHKGPQTKDLLRKLPLFSFKTPARYSLSFYLLIASYGEYVSHSDCKILDSMLVTVVSFNHK